MAFWHDMAARLAGLTSARARPRRADTTLMADTEAGAVAVHFYRPPNAADDLPVYLQFPDGDFVARAAGGADAYCRALADAAGMVVVLADLEGAPGLRFPALPTRAQALVWWVMLAGRKHGWNGKRLVLGGAGAGANLALGACLELPARMGARPLGVVAQEPWLDLDRAPASWRRRLARAAYLPDDLARRAPLASPLHAPDESLAGFPATLMLLGEVAPQKGDGAAFAARLAAAGRDVRTASVSSGAGALPDAALPFLRAVLGPASGPAG